MSSEDKRSQLDQLGYTVLKGVLDSDTVHRLRAAVAPCAELARARDGPDAERLENLGTYWRQLDLGQLGALSRCDELERAITSLLGEGYIYGDPRKIDVLVEPGKTTQAKVLHRKRLTFRPHADLAHLQGHFSHPRVFLQFRAALYPDQSLGLIPGSQHYLNLVTEKKRAAGGTRYMFERNQDNTGAADRFVQNYFLALQRKARLIAIELEPGDVVIYRGTLLLAYQYYRDRIRRTLQGLLDTPEFLAFRLHQREAWAMGRRSGKKAWWRGGVSNDDLHRWSISGCPSPQAESVRS